MGRYDLVVAVPGIDVVEHQIDFDGAGFASYEPFDILDPTAFDLADFNCDGTPDIVMASGAGGFLVLRSGRNIPVNQPFGTGCAGSNGIPSISASPATSPGSLTFGVTGARASSAAVLAVAGDFVEQELGPGCFLYMPPGNFTFSSTTDQMGARALAFNIPPGFEGTVVYFQWAIFDPQGGLLGVLSLSDAVKVKFGAVS